MCVTRGGSSIRKPNRRTVLLIFVEGSFRFKRGKKLWRRLYNGEKHYILTVLCVSREIQPLKFCCYFKNRVWKTFGGRGGKFFENERELDKQVVNGGMRERGKKYVKMFIYSCWCWLVQTNQVYNFIYNQSNFTLWRDC